MRPQPAITTSLIATLLLAGCAVAARDPYAPLDDERPRSRTGVVTLAAGLEDIRFASLDGLPVDCPGTCAQGLRLPAGSHRLGLADLRDGAERPVELLVEPRHRYELRRAEGPGPERFGVLDLGEVSR